MHALLAPAIVLTLLGTGNPRPSADRFGPSTLVELPGAMPPRLLVDVGRGATIRLFQLGKGAGLASTDVVLLTHLHSDHVVGLPDLWLTGWLFGRDRPLRVYGPKGTAALVAGLKEAFAFDVRMRRDVDEQLPAAGVEMEAVEVEPGVVLEEGGVRVTAFAVDHGGVVPALGYRIDAGGRSVALSGDTRASEALVAATSGVDVLVHEVASPARERRSAQVKGDERIARILARHTSPEDAGRVFTRVAPRLAVYSHIVPSPADERDLVAPTRTTYKGRLAVGTDLTRIEVGAEIRVRRLRPPRDR